MSSCKCNLDHTLIMNDTLLNNMLHVEDNYVLTSSYFGRFGQQIKPSMRTTLATWILEVCEEQQCTDEVFSLAMNIFDRLMCVIDKCEKQHLQLLGSVCLFIASKVKTNVTSKLSAEKIVEYTDYSITLEELLDWELIVLHKLKWDVASLVANDFVEPLLHRLDGFNAANEKMGVLRKHSYILTALCSTDFKFSLYPPSMVASACILAAIDGLNSSLKQESVALVSIKLENELPTFLDACHLLSSKAHIDTECLLSLKELVEELFRQHSPCDEEEEENNECELVEEEQTEQEDEEEDEVTEKPCGDDSDEFVHENFDLDCCDYLDYNNLDDIDYEMRNFNFAAFNFDSNDAQATNSTDSFDIIEPSLFTRKISTDSLRSDACSNNYDRELNKFINPNYIQSDAKLSRSSSSSSGVSSSASGLHLNTNIINISNYRLTPPLPNTLPMPKFKSPSKSAIKKTPKKSKKSSKSTNQQNNHLILV